MNIAAWSSVGMGMTTPSIIRRMPTIRPTYPHKRFPLTLSHPVADLLQRATYQFGQVLSSFPLAPTGRFSANSCDEIVPTAP